MRTACGCEKEREIPNDSPPRFLEAYIYKRMANPLDMVRSLDEVVEQDIHTRKFEFQGEGFNGIPLYSEVF